MEMRGGENGVDVLIIWVVEIGAVLGRHVPRQGA